MMLELPSEDFIKQPAQTVRNLLQPVDASVDEAALTEAPSVDHHEVLQAPYVAADHLRLGIRNLFG